MTRKEALDILRNEVRNQFIYSNNRIEVSLEALKKVLETEPKYFVHQNEDLLVVQRNS